jgi:hypothetical protein
MFHHFVQRSPTGMKWLARLCKDQKRIEHAGHVLDHCSYFLQQFFSLHVSGPGFTHGFDIGIDGSQVIAEIM